LVPSRLIIRNYAEGDLSKILDLYNSTSNNNPSFSRDEHFIRYCARYPGVSEDSIFVAVENENIYGLAIVSISNVGDLKQGNIIELVGRDSSSLELLLQTAEDYCIGKDVDMIATAEPANVDISNVFFKWIRFERTVMMCRPLSILPLVHALLNREEIKNCFAGKQFFFTINTETIQITVKSGDVEVFQLDMSAIRGPLSVVMSSEVFLQISFGTLNPYMAYLTRRLQIKRPRSIPIILRLLRVITLDSPWSTALVDCV